MSVDPRSAAWLRCRHPHPAPRYRLVIFPHAGGTANPYCAWAEGLPGDGETWVVRYPGREDRLAEPLIDSMDELVDGVSAALLPLVATGGPAGGDRPPLILFGHSMGASVAYETARRLETRHPGSVARLVVSARLAPGTDGYDGRIPVHRLPRDEFVDVLRAHGGTEDAIFEHAELMALVLPIIRNDYRLIETYRPPVDAALPVDVVAFAATGDPTVRVADVLAWAGVTTAGFEHEVFPGGHFYLRADPAPVLDALARRLTTPARRPPPASPVPTGAQHAS